MKYLRLFSMMLSCFMAAASVQAMGDFKNEGGEVRDVHRLLSVQDEFEISYVEGTQKETAASLARAACFASKVLGRRDERAFSQSVYDEIERLSQLIERRENFDEESQKLWDERTEQEIQVSWTYVRQGRLLDLMKDLDEVTSASVWTERAEAVAYHYIRMLLHGYGIEEWRQVGVKKKIFSLIESFVERYSNIDEELLFYLLRDYPGKSLTRDCFMRFQDKIKEDKKYYTSLRMNYKTRISSHRFKLLEYGQRALERAGISLGESAVGGSTSVPN